MSSGKDFLHFLNAQGIGYARQLKYIYPIEKLGKWLNKDFQNASRSDIENICNLIENEKSFSNWTKRDYKITIKKFYTWLYNKNNPDVDEWDPPKIIKFIKIRDVVL